MIKSIHFKNFKVLRDATLPLSRFTLIVGPNGSGKSTAMQALVVARNPSKFRHFSIATTGSIPEGNIEIKINWDSGVQIAVSKSGWKTEDNSIKSYGPQYSDASGGELPDHFIQYFNYQLDSFKIFSFDAKKLSAPVELLPQVELQPDGSNLAGVLDKLRDDYPERFDALNEELGSWLPEFDHILFETPTPGCRAFLLRTRIGQHRIEAADLSQGTLFAIAFLTLAYLPNHPAIICFEEPERGVHPRLLREIRDGMYRLSYPQSYNEMRTPVQVIATTHSPYLLDLYKDHPEEIVIAHKDEQGVHFERLSDKPNVDEFLQDAPLGEVWYSGILGGVPSKP